MRSNKEIFNDNEYLLLTEFIYNINTYSKKNYFLEWIAKNDYLLIANNNQKKIRGNYKTISDFLTTIVSGLSTKMNSFIYKGKKCYIASVSLLDGVIEEAYNFEDFFYKGLCNHLDLFSKPQIEKIESLENACFVIIGGYPKVYRYYPLKSYISSKIMEQITLI